MPVKTTKIETVRKMLARKSGASIVQIQTATEWQPHTIRAALSRFRKAGETIAREKTAKGIAIYRIAQGGDRP